MASTPASVVEVRYLPAEAARLAAKQGYALEYAQFFLTEPLFYGTSVVQKRKGAILANPKRAVLAVDYPNQIYRKGVAAVSKPFKLDSRKYIVANVPPPAWSGSLLKPTKSETLEPLASESGYVVQSCYTEASLLKGNTLAHNLCLTLQFAGIRQFAKEQERHQNAFVIEAQTYIRNRLAERINSSMLNRHEFQDAMSASLLRLIDELSKYAAQMFPTGAKKQNSKFSAKPFPSDYPLGPELQRFQARVVAYLNTISDTAVKRLQRESSKAERLAVKAQELGVQDSGVLEVLDKRGPFHQLFVKEGKDTLRKLLPKKLWKMLLLRAEWGFSFEQIAKRFRVSKVMVFKHFQTMRQKIGVHAVQTLAGYQTVEEYLHSVRGPRKKVQDSRGGKR